MYGLSRTLLSVIFLFAEASLAQPAATLDQERKACAAVAAMPVKLDVEDLVAGKPLRFGQRLTATVGIGPSHVGAAVFVWVNDALQVEVTGDELASFQSDGFGKKLPFEVSVQSKAEQPKMSSNGAFRLVLAQAQKSTITVLAKGTSNSTDACGTFTVDYETGSVDTYALVLGFNYDGSKQLQYASADAQAMTRHLISSLNLKPANIWLLTDDPGMTSKVPQGVKVILVESPRIFRDSLNSILAQADPQSKLYFYYSGHMLLPQGTLGAPSLSFFLPKSIEDDVGTMVLRKEVLEALEKGGLSSAVVILDACFSGTATVSAAYGSGPVPKLVRGAKAWRGHAPGTSVAGPEVRFSGAMIASSNGISPSWELDQFRHGVFTYFLLKATEGKKFLTLDEAYKEAKRNMTSLKPEGWNHTLGQEPTNNFNDLEIPWVAQP